MPYIGRSTEAFGVRSRFTYLASASDTSVSGADVNGLSLSFTDGAYVDVFLNGVRLKHGTDYVTTTANTISSLAALAANDEVEVVVFDVFSLADMVSKANGGTFEGRVDFNGGVGGSGGTFTLKNTDTSDDSFPVVTLQTGDTDIAQSDVLGRILFQAPDEGTGTDAITSSARIQALSEGDFSSSNNATSIEFRTATSGVVGTAAQGSRLTLQSDANLILKDMDTADGSSPTITLQTGDTDIAQDDVLGTINFQAPDEGTGTDAILVAAGIRAVSEGNFSSSNNEAKLEFMTGATAAASTKMALSSGGDLSILTDGASIFFGADSEIELRHVADDGLILKHVGTGDGKEPSLTFQAGDNDIAQDDVLGQINFQAPDEGAGTDAILVASTIKAFSEGDFSSSNNATTLELSTGRSAAAGSDGGRIRLTSAGVLELKNLNTADDSFPTITLQTGDTDIAQGDALGKINFQAPDEGAGTDAITVAASIQAVSEGDFSASNNATSVVIFTGESEAAESDGGGKYTFDSFGQLFLKNTTNADGSTPALRFETGDTDIAQSDMLGRIMFTAPDEGTGTDAILLAAEIRAISEGDFAADNNATSLSFLTAASGSATESMSINSAGAVAIGKGGVAHNDFSGFQCMTLGGSAATTGSLIDLEDSSGNIDGRVSGEEGNLLLGADPSAATGSSKITLQVDGTERAKIENTGKLSVFGDSSAQVGLLQNADSSPYGQQISFSAAAPNNTTNWFLSCNDNSAQNFIVFSSGTAKNSTGTYTSFSDERLKSNIVDAKSQWEDIKALKFKNFNKFDNPDLKQLGLIAQDVEKTSANLVFETPPNEFEIKHSSDFGTLYEDGDTIPEGKKIGDVKEVKSNVKNVKDSILYMKAVKALQEAMTRIETLETKVKALEDA